MRARRGLALDHRSPLETSSSSPISPAPASTCTSIPEPGPSTSCNAGDAAHPDCQDRDESSSVDDGAAHNSSVPSTSLPHDNDLICDAPARLNPQRDAYAQPATKPCRTRTPTTPSSLRHSPDMGTPAASDVPEGLVSPIEETGAPAKSESGEAAGIVTSKLDSSVGVTDDHAAIIDDTGIRNEICCCPGTSAATLVSTADVVPPRVVGSLDIEHRTFSLIWSDPAIPGPAVTSAFIHVIEQQRRRWLLPVIQGSTVVSTPSHAKCPMVRCGDPGRIFLGLLLILSVTTGIFRFWWTPWMLIYLYQAQRR